MSPVAAIREACLLRFRPIMMTTAAALLAGVPLVLGNGTGSELRQRLGYAMVNGLALSQLLMLYTTLAVYLYLDRLQNWLHSERAARRTRYPRRRRGVREKSGRQSEACPPHRWARFALPTYKSGLTRVRPRA